MARETQREVIFVQALVVKSARKPNWIERTFGQAGGKEWARRAAPRATASAFAPKPKWWPLHTWASQLAPAKSRPERRADQWVNWTFGGALLVFAAALAFYWR